MRILITNDDGVFAPGIKALAKRLEKEHDVVVVAPAVEQSGVGHSITYLAPLFAREVKIEGVKSPVFAVEGRPVDCVKLGCKMLCDGEPDIVVSGINQGGNLGVDVFPSGTVNAALTAAMAGLSAVAVSLCDFYSADFEPAAEYAARLLDFVRDNPIPKGRVLNLNVPALPMEQIKGIKLAKMDSMGFHFGYEERENPSGRKYYWMTTAMDRYGTCAKNTDCKAVVDGYASLTMLKPDLTDNAGIKKLQATGFFVE